MFIGRHFMYVCLCVIGISSRSDSDYNKEATYLLAYLLRDVVGLHHVFDSYYCFIRPPGTLAPKALCFSRDVFLPDTGSPSSVGRPPRNFAQ